VAKSSQPTLVVWPYDLPAIALQRMHFAKRPFYALRQFVVVV
jgi:hypothetical protein